jgi:hypothetical protein
MRYYQNRLHFCKYSTKHVCQPRSKEVTVHTGINRVLKWAWNGPSHLHRLILCHYPHLMGI